MPGPVSQPAAAVVGAPWAVSLGPSACRGAPGALSLHAGCPCPLAGPDGACGHLRGLAAAGGHSVGVAFASILFFNQFGNSDSGLGTLSEYSQVCPRKEREVREVPTASRLGGGAANPPGAPRGLCLEPSRAARSPQLVPWPRVAPRPQPRPHPRTEPEPQARVPPRRDRGREQQGAGPGRAGGGAPSDGDGDRTRSASSVPRGGRGDRRRPQFASAPPTAPGLTAAVPGRSFLGS